MEIIKGKQKTSWIAVLYGVPGIGKSTMATFAPKPIFLNIEDGLARVECDKTPRLDTWEKLYNALRWAHGCDYQTIVIDTITSVEEVLVKKLLDELNTTRPQGHELKTLSDQCKELAYGAGYEMLKSEWQAFTKILFLIKDAGKNVLCVAHEQVEKVENPSGENYDRTSLAIHKKSIPILISKMDAVFYAYYDKAYRKKESSDKLIAVETGRRLLEVNEKPYCAAKNRFNLVEPMPFNNPEEAGKFWGMIE